MGSSGYTCYIWVDYGRLRYLTCLENPEINMFAIQITTSLCTCSSCGVVVLTWLCWGGFQMDHWDTPSKQMVRNTWSWWWKMHVSCHLTSILVVLKVIVLSSVQHVPSSIAAICFLKSPNFVEERVNSPKFQNNKIVKKWEPQNRWCSSRWSSQLRIHGMVIKTNRDYRTRTNDDF